MSKTDQICKTCGTKIDAVFNAATGTRVIELINGQRLVTDCCFVADEIHFTGDSQLIFAPTGGKNPREQKYCPEYHVVCRKLVIQGGHDAKDPTPCSADDPGRMYSANNVITWLDRLKSAPNGPDQGQANPGNPDFVPADYQDQGQGDDGKNGGNGSNGNVGQPGGNGAQAPPFVLLALEVDAGPGDHLTIDFDGENGGNGGKGQKGGKGGHGMEGNKGQSDTSWPGEGCDRAPGNGGDGGSGGDGGDGGPGGRGGNAGAIVVVSTPANIGGAGVFFSTKFSYVNDGGDGGKGGKGGMGGQAGQGAKPGNKTQLCGDALHGSDGMKGDPQDANLTVDGPVGGHGLGAALSFEAVTLGTCADQIPLPPPTVTNVSPATGAQGTTGLAVTITGTNFVLGATVNVSGAFVSPSLPSAVTATQINCTIDIGNLASKTGRDVTVKNPGGATSAPLVNGFTVT